MALRPVPIDGNISSYLAGVGEASNTHHVTGGKGIVVRHTSQGTHISAKGEKRKDTITDRGNYDFTQEYWPNDLVYVDPNQVYKDQNGNPISFTSSGSGLPAINGGVFICSNHVPPFTADSTTFTSQVVPAFGGTVPSDMANSYRWYSYNCYYPIYPTIPTSSQALVTVGSSQVLANQTFWTPISPQTKMTICVDGEPIVAFVNCILSGSMFNLDTLPYSP